MVLTRFLLIHLVFFAALTVNAEARRFAPPPMSGPVNDLADMIQPITMNQLDQALRNLWHQTGTQIAVLTVETLEGLSIEEATIKTVEAWKLGSAKQDRGLLLMVAKKERSMRIEVGQGLEGQLTDVDSHRIIDTIMVPLFRKGNVDAGIVMGLNAVVNFVEPKFPFESYFGKRGLVAPRDRHGGKNWLGILFTILFFIFVFGSRSGLLWFLLGVGLGGGRSRSWGSSSGWPSGFGGGSGGGSGGWSGGGGGFSGGGASGRW